MSKILEKVKKVWEELNGAEKTICAYEYFHAMDPTKSEEERHYYAQSFLSKCGRLK